ncbi:MAG: transposase [Burkholderiaceae bacterium]|nr:transposase [Burkholderiaceae bacterium]
MAYSENFKQRVLAYIAGGANKVEAAKCSTSGWSTCYCRNGPAVAPWCWTPASFHKAEYTRRLVEHAGCQLLYLTPYSPDLNPIEKLWANLKRRWRKVGGALEEMIVTSDYFGD